MTEAEKPAEVQKSCRRAGCGKKYFDSTNKEGDCVYHPGPVSFRDVRKAWLCCNQDSWEWEKFRAIPGCKTGKHSDVKPGKPGIAKRAPNSLPQQVKPAPVPVPIP